MLKYLKARGPILSVIFFALCASSSLTFAALGGAPLAQSPSVATALREFKSVSPASTPNYTIQVVELASGTVVHEFVSESGVVFALNWRGPVLPDFGMVLGTSVTVFNSEARLARVSGKRGGPLGIRAKGLVVLSAGHMRSFHGYAYLEPLVPANVDILSLVQ